MHKASKSPKRSDRKRQSYNEIHVSFTKGVSSKQITIHTIRMEQDNKHVRFGGPLTLFGLVIAALFR